MVFSSSIFIFFFLPLVLVMYILAPVKAKNLLLLIASLIFYAWGEGYLVFLLLLSTIFNYLMARLIGAQQELTSRRIIVIFGILGNLLLLGYYKYANFLVDNYNIFATSVGIPRVEIADIGLPIGISFFTFQAISYLVDVYRGTAELQKKYIDTALYISLFPQLVAGPIIRYHDVASQIRDRKIALGLFSEGVRRFIIGLAKKLLFANPLGYVADQIFNIPTNELSWELAWLGAVCYALQIYFDFSGYSDMAIGLGRMFGFRFLENFNYPYISRSVREFWRRWHISLSNWFRDYLYIPLGGNRVSPTRTYINLVIVFMLCGLWHGASWTFVVWGFYHGAFLVIERAGLDRIISQLWRPLQHAYALMVVLIGWVIFRSSDLDHALGYLKIMLGISTNGNILHPTDLYITNEIVLVIIIGAVVSTGIYDRIVKRIGRMESLETNEPKSRIPASVLSVVEPIYLSTILVLVCTYLAAGTYNPFIYFRF